MLASRLVAVLLLTRAALGLRCRCSHDGCLASTCAVSEERNGYCLSSPARSNSSSESGSILTCSEDGTECATLGARCCRDGDYCNERLLPALSGGSPPSRTERKNDGQAVESGSKVTRISFLPPRSGRKLRCDCRNREGCRQDRGNRGQQHCIVRNGWCVAQATRAGPLSPVQYSYFCTETPVVCRLSGLYNGNNYNTICCSHDRFCNEDFRPELRGVSGSFRDHTQTLIVPGSQTPTTQLPDLGTTAEASALSRPKQIWCHCLGSDSCQNQTWCETDGACFSGQKIRDRVQAGNIRDLQMLDSHLFGEAVQYCISSSSSVHCHSNPGSCCTTDCCNGEGPCKPGRMVSPTIKTEVSLPTGRNVETRRCHCTTCVGKQCSTQGACTVDVNATSGQSISNCVSAHTFWCSPSLIPQSGITSVTRKVYSQGHVLHRYCCLGDVCNRVHPDFLQAKEEKFIECNCTDPGRCERDVCVVPENGACYYSTKQGSGCVMPSKRAKQCSSPDTICCQKDFCNAKYPKSVLESTKETLSRTTILIASIGVCILFFITVFLTMLLWHRSARRENTPLSKKNSHTLDSRPASLKQMAAHLSNGHAASNGTVPWRPISQSTVLNGRPVTGDLPDSSAAVVSRSQRQNIQIGQLPYQNPLLEHSSNAAQKSQSNSHQPSGSSLLRISNL